MKKSLGGFMEFVRTHGVVGLAVGLAIGTQVGKVVTDIVNGLINPIVGFVLGNKEGLESATWYVEAGDRSMTIGWGLVVSSLITLLAVSAVIYYAVHGLKLDRLDKKKDEGNK